MLFLILWYILLKIRQKNSVETTYLILRFPRLHFQQVVPRRNTRRFANLFLKVCPKMDYRGKMSIKNLANRYLTCLII